MLFPVTVTSYDDFIGAIITAKYRIMFSSSLSTIFVKFKCGFFANVHGELEMKVLTAPKTTVIFIHFTEKNIRHTSGDLSLGRIT